MQFQGLQQQRVRFLPSRIHLGALNHFEARKATTSIAPACAQNKRSPFARRASYHARALHYARRLLQTSVPRAVARLANKVRECAGRYRSRRSIAAAPTCALHPPFRFVLALLSAARNSLMAMISSASEARSRQPMSACLMMLARRSRPVHSYGMVASSRLVETAAAASL
eukprot:423521-Pleurochrysis_carterae.AAC.3